MPTFIKICGLRTPRAVAAACAAGADAVGFVFADSPRRVTPAEARVLCADLPSGVLRVAVMRHPSAQEWAAVQAEFAPDWLQTDAEDFAGLDLHEDIAPLPVYRDTPALDESAAMAAPRLLFEAAASGSGQQADWGRAGRLARGTELMLAGGLKPDNVASALRTARPWGVDVSSGVESAPGEKDEQRIAAFVRAVRDEELRRAN